MKKLILAILTFCFLFSCGNKVDDVINPTTGNSYVKMKVDGVQLQGTFTTSGFLDLGFSSSGNVMVNGVNEGVNLIVMETTGGTGTYNLTSDINSLFSYNRISTGETFQIRKDIQTSSGTVVITKTKVINGATIGNCTFSGTAVSASGKTIQITEGEMKNPLVD